MTDQHDNFGHNSGGASGELESFVVRIERLEQEKREIQQDISEVKRAAKSAGFDVKTINKILKERQLTPAQIEEEQALLDIYRAALGMLNDTPLGEAARRRLSGESPKSQKPGENPQQDQAESPDETGAPAQQNEEGGFDIDQAREAGRQAQMNGQPVTANPFPARDPRRAAWDEAWCHAAGSDGMDIPEAWQRKKPKKDKSESGPEARPETGKDGATEETQPEPQETGGEQPESPADPTQDETRAEPGTGDFSRAKKAVRKPAPKKSGNQPKAKKSRKGGQ